MSFLSLATISLLLLVPVAFSQPPPCLPGRYALPVSLSPPTSICIPCPAGTFLPTGGAAGIDLCIDCPPNTFSTVSGATSSSTCTPCGPGQISTSGANTCIRCNPGSRIVPCPPRRDTSSRDSPPFLFRGECFIVPFLNRFAIRAGEQAPRCERCPEGTVSTQPNSFSCETCPEGLGANPDRSRCIRLTCPPGQSLRNGVCTSCGDSFIVDEDNLTCGLCPPGEEVRTIRGVRECRPCPAGTSSFGGSCLDCRRDDENIGVTGAQFCLPAVRNCPDNFFVGNGGACLTCSVGERYDRTSNTCVPCPPGATSNGGVETRCRRCGRGMVVGGFQAGCNCQEGWGWVEGSGRRRCRRCPPGTASTGRGFCSPCERDTIAPNSGMSECIPCEGTLTQPRTGRRACVPRRCPRGLVPSSHAGCVMPTTNCPPGQERVETNGLDPDCVPRSAADCASGTVFLGSRFRPPRCGTCVQGERYNKEEERCEGCPEGTTSDGGVTETCVPCPAGLESTFSDCKCRNAMRLTRGRCLPCPRGTFGFRDVDGCRPCEVGTASNLLQRSTPCNRCRSGTFAAAPGSRECRPCPNGTISIGAGESSCFQLA